MTLAVALDSCVYKTQSSIKRLSDRSPKERQATKGLCRNDSPIVNYLDAWSAAGIFHATNTHEPNLCILPKYSYFAPADPWDNDVAHSTPCGLARQPSVTVTGFRKSRDFCGSKWKMLGHDIAEPQAMWINNDAAVRLEACSSRFFSCLIKHFASFSPPGKPSAWMFLSSIPPLSWYTVGCWCILRTQAWVCCYN